MTHEEIEALRAEVAELRAEVRDWLCEKCRTVYPGPPQPGVWCVVCPKCDGATAPLQTVLLREARAALSGKTLADGVRAILYGGTIASIGLHLRYVREDFDKLAGMLNALDPDTPAAAALFPPKAAP
jgi:hypothetical protein